MANLPGGITRYTGANTFSVQDAAGNVFFIFQKQHDAGTVIMERPNGTSVEVLSTPDNSGRPSLECNPGVGLWLTGNRETGDHATPPRYPVKEYVPFAAGALQLFDAPRSSPQWDARELSSGVWVDVPATFGVPAAAAYLVRLCGQAPYAEVTIRAGTEAAPHFFTLQTQAANVRKDAQGWVPGPHVYMSAIGAATVWLQICGYSG
jgi:hypothetical protein